MNHLVSKLINYIKKKHFVRNVLVLAGGTAFGQGLVVLVTPVLTRLYLPEHFGILAVYVSILSVLLVVVTFRYELAIPLPEDEESAANIIVLSLIIVSSISFLSLVGIVMLKDNIAYWTGTPALINYLWFIPLSLFGAGIYQIFNFWAIRKKFFNIIAKTKISQSVGQIFIQVAFGLLNSGTIGLILGDVVGRINGGTTLAIYSWKQEKKFLKQVSIKGIWTTAKRYIRFPLVSSGSALLNNIGTQLPSILFILFYDAQIAGWYALGQRVIGAPMQILGQAVAQVYLAEASQLSRQNTVALERLFLKTARNLFLIGILPISIIGIFGNLLFEVAFGGSWRVAGQFTQYLTLMFLAQFVVAPLSQTLNILDKQHWQLLWDIGRSIIVIGPLMVVGYTGMAASTAVIVYSILSTLAYLILGVLCYTCIIKLKTINETTTNVLRNR